MIAMTIPIPSGTEVWLVNGHTGMRKGFDGLALPVQETLNRDPYGSHLFVFRGRSGGLIKVLWLYGKGMCLLAERAAARPSHLATAGGRSGEHSGRSGMPDDPRPCLPI
jgi:transposase